MLESAGFTSYLAFTGAAALIVLLPGPDTLVVVRSILRGGRRAGVLTALGNLCGLAVWVTGAVLGITALLHASEVGYNALHTRLGIAMTNTQALTESRRPAGSNNLFVAWETLTHAENPS